MKDSSTEEIKQKLVKDNGETAISGTRVQSGSQIFDMTLNIQDVLLRTPLQK